MMTTTNYSDVDGDDDFIAPNVDPNIKLQESAERWKLYQRDIIETSASVALSSPRSATDTTSFDFHLIPGGEADERIVLMQNETDIHGSTGSAVNSKKAYEDNRSINSTPPRTRKALSSSSPMKSSSPPISPSRQQQQQGGEAKRGNPNVRKLKTRLELLKQRRKHRQVQVQQVHPKLPIELGQLTLSSPSSPNGNDKKKKTSLAVDEKDSIDMKFRSTGSSTTSAFHQVPQRMPVHNDNDDEEAKVDEHQHWDNSANSKDDGHEGNDIREFILNWGTKVAVEEDDDGTSSENEKEGDGAEAVATRSAASTSSCPSFYSESQSSQEYGRHNNIIKKDTKSRIQSTKLLSKHVGVYASNGISGENNKKFNKDVRAYTLDKLKNLDNISEMNDDDADKNKTDTPSDQKHHLRVLSMPSSFVSKYMKRPRRRNIFDSILCFDSRRRDDRDEIEQSLGMGPDLTFQPKQRSSTQFSPDEVENFHRSCIPNGHSKWAESLLQQQWELNQQLTTTNAEEKINDSSIDYSLVRIIGESRTAQHPWYINEEDKNEIGDLPIEEEEEEEGSQPVSCTNLLPSHRNRNKWYVRPQDPALVGGRSSTADLICHSKKTTDVPYLVINSNGATRGAEKEGRGLPNLA